MKYKMRYTVEKKKRTKSVKVPSGLWYVSDYRRCSFEAWCVLKDGRFFCEARSESAAKQIRNSLNNCDGLAGDL